MTIASLCTWAGRLESCLVANPRRHIFSWCIWFWDAHECLLCSWQCLKNPKYSDIPKNCCNYPKTMLFYHSVMIYADIMANNGDPSGLGQHCLPRLVCPKTLWYFGDISFYIHRRHRCPHLPDSVWNKKSNGPCNLTEYNQKYRAQPIPARESFKPKQEPMQGGHFDDHTTHR